MVSIRIERKEAFNVIGAKTWLPGTDNNAFGEFWKRCHQEGDIEKIKKFNTMKESSQTKSAILGLSCTEKDPSVRSFYFYIAVETDEIWQNGYPIIVYMNMIMVRNWKYASMKTK